MIYSENCNVKFHGKAVDILVEISLLMDRFLEMTPDELRDPIAQGMKESIDIALRLVRNRDKDGEIVAEIKDMDVVDEFIEKVINAYKEDEE